MIPPRLWAFRVPCTERRIVRRLRRCAVSSLRSTTRAWMRTGSGRSSRSTPGEPALRGTQERGGRELAWLRPACPLPGTLVGPDRPVPLSTAVADDLSTDRRGCSAHASGHRPKREAADEPATDLLALGQRQHLSGPTAWGRHVPAIRRHDAVDRTSLAAERPADLAVQLTKADHTGCPSSTAVSRRGSGPQDLRGDGGNCRSPPTRGGARRTLPRRRSPRRRASGRTRRCRSGGSARPIYRSD